MLDIELKGTNLLIATEMKKKANCNYLFRLNKNSDKPILEYIGFELVARGNEKVVEKTIFKPTSEPELIKRVFIKPKLEVIYDEEYKGNQTFTDYDKPHIKSFRIDPDIFDTLIIHHLIRYNKELAESYGLPVKEAFNYQKTK